MEKIKINPVLARMLNQVEEMRKELTEYGANLESSTLQSEQTKSYEVAEGALNLFESAIKSLSYDEFIITQNK